MAATAGKTAMLLEAKGVDAQMSAPFETCAKRSVVAVLASGVVISLTALTGGIAPAFAKPDTDQVVTTTSAAPEPKVQAPAVVDTPSQEAPPPKAPPVVEAPPQTQQAVEAPAPPVTPPPPPVTQSTTAPVVTAIAPAAPSTPVNPPVTKTDTATPRFVAPPTSESVTSTATSPSPATQSPSAASTSTSSATATASVAVVPPSAALVPPGSASVDVSPPSLAPVTPSSGSATPGSESKASEPKVSAAQDSSTVTTTGGPTVSVTQAAKVIAMSEPQTLQAPKADVELASKTDPIEVKADPAPKQDVDAVASSIGLNLGVKGPLGVDASVKADAKLTSDREPDRNIRQWSPDWVQYDEYYRPVIMNPYHERVRIV
jgi:hypothetical protein